MDDHGYYHYHPHDEPHDETALEDDSNSDGIEHDEKDREDATPDSEASAGAEDGPRLESIIRDEERGPMPKLESKKSSRSIRDPNLVTWDGPDDPANPKNWSMRRRWAATLIGRP